MKGSAEIASMSIYNPATCHLRHAPVCEYHDNIVPYIIMIVMTNTVFM